MHLVEPSERELAGLRAHAAVGETQLVITLHDSPIQWAPPANSNEWQSWTRGIVHGPQARYYLAGPKPKGTVVGVSFRPGMAAALLGASMQELQDSHVPLERVQRFSNDRIESPFVRFRGPSPDRARRWCASRSPPSVGPTYTSFAGSTP